MEALYILGALGSALASIQAALFAALFVSTQEVFDPVTHRLMHLPWWTIFRNGEVVPVFGSLVVAAGFGWLAWYLCRRAYRLGPWV